MGLTRVHKSLIACAEKFIEDNILTGIVTNNINPYKIILNETMFLQVKFPDFDFKFKNNKGYLRKYNTEIWSVFVLIGNSPHNEFVEFERWDIYYEK